MPENRFYIEVPFQENGLVELSGDEFHHLHVMRRKPGDKIELVNGKGELAKSILQETGKRSARIEIRQVLRMEKKEKKRILVQAIVRLSALEYIVEKGTELGISEFWLFPAVHTEKKEVTDHQRKRLQLMAISALKQCGRLDLPPIHEKPPLQKWASLKGEKYYGDVRKEAPPFFSSKASENLYFFIGPERGFSEAEIEWMEKNQVKGVKLHENILRVDTAAITAAILISL